MTTTAVPQSPHLNIFTVVFFTMLFGKTTFSTLSLETLWPRPSWPYLFQPENKHNIVDVIVEKHIVIIPNSRIKTYQKPRDGYLWSELLCVATRSQHRELQIRCLHFESRESRRAWVTFAPPPCPKTRQFILNILTLSASKKAKHVYLRNLNKGNCSRHHTNLLVPFIPP